MTAFIVSKCARCGKNDVSHNIVGQNQVDTYDWEIQCRCQSCLKSSLYLYTTNFPTYIPANNKNSDITNSDVGQLIGLVRFNASELLVSSEVPSRVADLLKEASFCREMGKNEAAGAMYRKTVDVATKHIYATHPKLAGKNAATNLRPRIKSMGELGVLEDDIVELADVAALEGNDAVHEADPYTAEEVEALDYLTTDLLDRLFVKPARFAAVKAKQIAAGQRKAD